LMKEIQSASRRRAAKAEGLAQSRTLREIQSSPELAERLDCGDFSTAFCPHGEHPPFRPLCPPTAPLKPAHSKRFARFGRHQKTRLRFGLLRLSTAFPLLRGRFTPQLKIAAFSFDSVCG
jgi:hypothetical protein